jgi:hypothetical protein
MLFVFALLVLGISARLADRRRKGFQWFLVAAILLALMAAAASGG